MNISSDRRTTEASRNATDRKGIRTYNTNIMFLSHYLYDSSVANMCETLRSSFQVRIPFSTCCICKERGTCAGPHSDRIRQKRSQRERCTALDGPATTSAVRFRVKAPRYLTPKAATTMRLQTLKPPQRTTDRKSGALPHTCKCCSRLRPSPRLKDFTD